MFIVSVLFILCLLTIAGLHSAQLPVFHRSTKDRDDQTKICGRVAAEEYRNQLQQMLLRCQWLAKSLDGIQQERLQWIIAKIQYALHRSETSEQLDCDSVRELLESTYMIVLRGSHEIDEDADILEEEAGGRLRTYRSPVDGTLQTYSVSVPPDYDPAVSWPVIVYLHGHGGYAPFQGHPAPSFKGAICLSPQGRGASDYKALGEDDVLATLHLIQQQFNIDPDRIYLTGTSMGGTGCFNLGVHYADRFAAIFPIAGNADADAWTERWGWNHDFPGRNSAVRQLIQQTHSAQTYCGNLFNLPAFILAGGGDTIVPPAHSRNMAETMKRENMTVCYREYPDAGHGGFPSAALQEGLAWMCSWKRNPFPKDIRWKTSQLKHGKAYWTRIDQLDTPLEPGEIHVRAVDAHSITVDTHHVSAFSFQRPSALFDEKLPFSVTVDERTLSIPPADDAFSWTQLRKDPNHGWRLHSDLPLELQQKKDGCEGPVQEALMKPFLLVIGTQNDTMTAAWKEEAVRFAEEWQRRNGGMPRIVHDVDVDESMEMDFNLVLLGGANDNLVSSRQVISMPFADIQALLSSRNYEVTLEQLEQPTIAMPPPVSSDNPLDSPSVGMFMVYPNDLNKDRLTVIWTANSRESAYQGWWRFGNWFNWGVLDSDKYFDYAVYDSLSCNLETMLLVGWFGPDWQVASGRYFFANETVRAASAPQQYPVIDDVWPSVNILPLSHVKPSHIDQTRGAVGFGRTFFGEPLPDGLGLRAPSRLDYTLQGEFTTFVSEVALLNPREAALCKQRKDGEKVCFQVLGDQDDILAEITLDWKHPHGKLEASVVGVKKLTLSITTSQGPAWLHMGAAWLKPSLLKE